MRIKIKSLIEYQKNLHFVVVVFIKNDCTSYKKYITYMHSFIIFLNFNKYSILIKTRGPVLCNCTLCTSPLAPALRYVSYCVLDT